MEHGLGMGSLSERCLFALINVGGGSAALRGEFGKLKKRSLNHQNKKGRRRFPLSATALDPERLVRPLASKPYSSCCLPAS